MGGQQDATCTGPTAPFMAPAVDATGATPPSAITSRRNLAPGAHKR
jgi:hypothetical protein